MSQNGAEYKISGQQNLNNGNFDQAVTDFTQAIGMNPNDAELYYCRSIAHYGIGVVRNDSSSLDLAIKDCNQAIKLNPDYAAAYSTRGGAYFTKGEYDMAIDDLNRAIQLNLNDYSAYNARGGAYIMKNEFDRGIKDLETSLRINPDQPDISNNLEMTRMMQKKHNALFG